MLNAPSRLSNDQAGALAGLGQEDFYFFTLFILKRHRLSGPRGYHGRVCKAYSNITNPLMVAAWRESFKTTIGSEAAPTWETVKDPLHFDYIDVGSDLALARSRLAAIGSHCENNRLLRRLYPYMKPRKGYWTHTQKTIIGRDPLATGPTFEVRTTKQPSAGRHVRRINWDDPVNDSNYRSRDEQDELKRRFDDFWPTVTESELGADEVTFEVTFWADYDLNSHIIQQLYPDMLDLFIQPVRGYAEVGPAGQIEIVDDGAYAFPGEWDDARFERTRRKMDPSMFYAQYMLDLTPRAERAFQRAWLAGKYLALEELPELTIYMAVDGASTKGTSRPAIAVGGIDANNDVYAKVAVSDFKTHAEFIDAIFSHLKTHKPAKLAAENYGEGGRTLIETLRTEARRRGVYLPLVPVRGEKKEQRVPDVLWPLYQWGQMYHVQELRGSEYEAQLERFPAGGYDDEVDAMSYMVQLARKHGFRAPRPEEEKLRASLLHGVTEGGTLEQMMEPEFPDDEEIKVTEGFW